jgi:hypothetical protein
MNKKQKIVVLVIALFIVAMMLFPPFYYENRNAGYAFLSHRKIKLSYGYNEYISPDCMVNVSLLSMQFFVALVFGAALFFFFKDSNKTENE